MICQRETRRIRYQLRGPHLVRGRSSITGYVPSPARPSASAFKTFVTSLPEPTGASQTQRSEVRHNPSVEMATLTTAEGTRTPPVLQNFLYCQNNG